MNYYRRFLLSISFSMVVISMNSQDFDFVRTIDGKNYWANVKIENFDNVDDISVQDGRRMIRIPMSDVLLIEYMGSGLKILQPNKMKKVEPISFDGNLESFIGEGKRVYVPLASNINQQRWGAKRLREQLMEDNYWVIVGCEEEADFILEYVFDDNGPDHAYLLLSDRRGKHILFTSEVGARDYSPVWAGEESSEKLYKKAIINCIMKGNLMKKVKEVKNPSKKNYNCHYFLKL